MASDDVASVLRERGAELLASWRDRVSDDPGSTTPRPERATPILVDEVPRLIESMVTALERTRAPAHTAELSPRAIGPRAPDLATASSSSRDRALASVRELSHLRVALFDLLARNEVAIDESTATWIHSTIDAAMQSQVATAQFAERRSTDFAPDASESVNRATDQFLATVSHELRTPLSAILGWTQLLRTGSVPGDRVQHALETIERNAQAQTRMIEELLDVSRITSGTLRLEPRPLDPAPIVRAAIDSLESASRAKEIHVRMLVEAEPSCVLADACRLQQIAWSLVANAVKFTPRGGRVCVLLHRVDDSLALTVEDTGVGIAPEFLPHVFDRFRQADAGLTRAFPGLGLGLALVRQLVELHGGTIEAYSNGVGKGARFETRLPLVHGAVEPASYTR